MRSWVPDLSFIDPSLLTPAARTAPNPIVPLTHLKPHVKFPNSRIARALDFVNELARLMLCHLFAADTLALEKIIKRFLDRCVVLSMQLIKLVAGGVV